MITLARKLRKDASDSENHKRISIRDRLLVKEVQEVEQTLPPTCKLFFTDPNILSEFLLSISPDEGFWRSGKFKFSVIIPQEYNMAVNKYLFCIDHEMFSLPK